ncbi:MAG: MarR family transcriptional regulator [Comamonas sp.]|nr:MarR family transcriptional regulator [Comamonas sp.]
MPKSDHGPGSAAELLDVVVRLNRWVTHHSDWPLPLAQVRVLSQIDEWGQARTSDLARVEHCSQPTMTTRVQRLQARGWVARASDPLDARATMLTLTEEGRAVLADARATRARVLEALMAHMNAPERERVQAATRTLSALLDIAYASHRHEQNKTP